MDASSLGSTGSYFWEPLVAVHLVGWVSHRPQFTNEDMCGQSAVARAHHPLAAPSAHARLTIRRGREDEGLAAIDANVAQVVQQRVVGGAAVAQGHQLLRKHKNHNCLRAKPRVKKCSALGFQSPGAWLPRSKATCVGGEGALGLGFHAVVTQEKGLQRGIGGPVTWVPLPWTLLHR